MSHSSSAVVGVPNHRLLVVVLIGIFLLAGALWLGSRSSLKWSRFASPDTLYFNSVLIEDDRVLLSGGTASSMLSYQGYQHEISDGTLFVGLEFSARDGGLGEFSIVIPTTGNAVQSVFVVGGGERRRLK